MNGIILMPNGKQRRKNQRFFRFHNLHGYKGKRLIIGFYEAYLKPAGEQQQGGMSKV
jgi:hypothetical protein